MKWLDFDHVICRSETDCDVIMYTQVTKMIAQCSPMSVYSWVIQQIKHGSEYWKNLFHCYCSSFVRILRTLGWVKLKISVKCDTNKVVINIFTYPYLLKLAADMHLSMMKINSIHWKLFSILQKVHLSFCRTHAPAAEHNNYHHYHQ